MSPRKPSREPGSFEPAKSEESQRNNINFNFIFQIPEYVWSEEYQVALMSEHFKAFDRLRQHGFFSGEFIWNFADFKTAQSKQSKYLIIFGISFY